MRTRIWTVTAMPLFSNRPGIERMMQQKPAGGKEPETPGSPAGASLSWLRLWQAAPVHRDLL